MEAELLVMPQSAVPRGDEEAETVSLIRISPYLQPSATLIPEIDALRAFCKSNWFFNDCLDDHTTESDIINADIIITETINTVGSINPLFALNKRLALCNNIFISINYYILVCKKNIYN